MIEEDRGTQVLRKTKPSLIYTSENPPPHQILMHSSSSRWCHFLYGKKNWLLVRSKRFTLQVRTISSIKFRADFFVIDGNQIVTVLEFPWFILCWFIVVIFRVFFVLISELYGNIKLTIDFLYLGIPVLGVVVYLFTNMTSDQKDIKNQNEFAGTSLSRSHASEKTIIAVI